MIKQEKLQVSAIPLRTASPLQHALVHNLSPLMIEFQILQDLIGRI